MPTADVSYVPGALTAVAGDQCWALVETSPDSPAVTRIWRQLGQGVAADVLLAGLLTDGIGGTPGFALLVAGPGRQHRLFCRGTVGATVVPGPLDGSAPTGAGPALTERIDGAGLLTWREQVVERAERIFLGGPPAQASLRLPATSGVLLAGCVVIDLTPHQTPAPRAESGPGEPESAVKRAELPERVARTTPPDRIGPVVPALLCPSRHVNPPSGAVCRRCGAPLPHDPVPVPRPVLGVLRLSLGDVIGLDRGVLMGRNPRTDFGGTEGEERPHVVKLPSADGDISRTHLRVTLDGWHVLVTDLNSTNGTLVALPGRDPQQLRPGEPVPIQPGTVVTLADGIDFRYEAAD